MSLSCFHCSQPLDASLIAGTNFSRSETCHHCLADLHCCKMCEFFDPASYNQCREPLAGRIVDKEKANFCDYFRATAPQNKNKSEKDRLLDLANSLFKK